jgi:hypothetical protein
MLSNVVDTLVNTAEKNRIFDRFRLNVRWLQMGIKSDFEEFRDLWNRGNFWLRGLAIVFLFIQVGSLASLSDTIFEFRGFIRDGIQLYEEWIRDPLKMLLSSLFGVRITSLHLNFIVWWGIVCGAQVRSYLTLPEKARAVGGAVGAVIAFIITQVLAFNILAGIHPSLSPTGVKVIVVTLIICTWYVSTSFKSKSVFYVSVLSPILIVGILAAISSGVSRSV